MSARSTKRIRKTKWDRVWLLVSPALFFVTLPFQADAIDFEVLRDAISEFSLTPIQNISTIRSRPIPANSDSLLAALRRTITTDSELYRILQNGVEAHKIVFQIEKNRVTYKIQCNYLNVGRFRNTNFDDCRFKNETEGHNLSRSEMEQIFLGEGGRIPPLFCEGCYFIYLERDRPVRRRSYPATFDGPGLRGAALQQLRLE